MEEKEVVKNTIYKVEFADAHAWHEFLESSEGNIETIDWNEKKMRIEVIYSRYTMDCNGYYIGYEYYTIHWKMFKKTDLNITGIPPSIFPYVVIPEAFDIKRIKGPIRDCSVYSKPDADFVYQEIEHYIRNWRKNIPGAHFTFHDRTWTCGDYVMPLD